MHLILTGATGLVGSAVLHQMLTTPSVSKISILSRRPVAQAEGHEKAKVFIQKDFSNYEKNVLDELRDAHGVVWAQGISSTKVDKTSVFPRPFPL
jgi:NAD dependent epimerase/dehydratase family enzyme